jgi:hypothetical protein
LAAAATSPPAEIQGCEKRCMQEFIARKNIERFRTLLSETRDASKRQTLLQLLKAEEKKLADLQVSAATKKPDDHI